MCRLDQHGYFLAKRGLHRVSEDENRKGDGFFNAKFQSTTNLLEEKEANGKCMLL